MPVSLSIKNVPDDLAEKLRLRAKLHHRSLQGELMAILEEASGRTPARGTLSLEEAEARIKALNIHTSGDSTQIVREMRDARYGS